MPGFDYLDEAGKKGLDRMVQQARAERTAGKRHPPPGGSRESARVELQSAASITPQAIEWVWPGWVARGRLHILAGQPAAGKTTLALEFAAIISSGGCWPDGSRAKPATVVIWSGKDDPGDTLVPRLIAAGADLKRVHFVRGAREDDRPRAFDPARDMNALEKEVQRIGNVALVIIDPVALIATKDSHKNAETRRDLQPLADLCRATGAAAIGIHHLAKGTAGREPQERLIGSVAFAAVARIVMIAAKQPAQESGAPERRIFMRAKSNIGPDDDGFAYGLEQAGLEKYPGVSASRVVWGERIEGTARDVLADVEQANQDRRQIDDAKDFFRAMLAEGPIAQKQIKLAADANCHSWATVRRAKKALGVQGLDDCWVWQLPNMLTHPEEAHLSGVSTFGRGEHLRDGVDYIETEF
jgi:putative DNA primase/helicase